MKVLLAFLRGGFGEFGGWSSEVAYICSRYYRAPELIFGASN